MQEVTMKSALPFMTAALLSEKVTKSNHCSGFVIKRQIVIRFEKQ